IKREIIKIPNVLLIPEKKLPIVKNTNPKSVMYIILVRSNNSPTIGLAITIAIKYTENISDIEPVTFKSSFIVGNANETIEVSIADINIISINATTTPNVFIFIFNLLTRNIHYQSLLNHYLCLSSIGFQ